MKKLSLLLGAMMLLAGCRKNQIPGGASVPSGPEFGRTGGRLRFTSSATDPDSDSVAIRFDWGDGDTSAWSTAIRSGAAVTDSHAWGESDTYLIRAQARDARGAISEWSDPCSLRIADNNPPKEPDMDDLSTVVAGESLCLVAYLDDPDTDSVAIRVSWGDGSTTDWSELIPSGEHISLYHAWVDTGTYLVTTQARDQYGATSSWTTGWPVVVWRPKWRYKTGGDIQGCPAVAADGMVYFGSDDGYLYAVHPNGALRWRYQTGAAVRSSPALAPDGTVYFGSNDGYLYALDPFAGALKWRYQTGDSVCSSPALAADGTVYVGSGDGYLYAIDANGILKWQYQTGGPIGSSPAVAADGTVYFGSDDHYLYAVDASGVLKWRYQTSWCVPCSPAIAADGTIYVVASRDLWAVDQSGALKWRCPGVGYSGSPVVGGDGTTYVGTAEDWNGGLSAINPDGTVKWYEATGDILSSVTLAANGTLYVVDDGYLYAVDPSGQNWRWGYKLGSGINSSPALGADGTVYIGSDDGYLYAIAGNSPLADSPWPKFHHDAKNTGRVGGGR